MDPDLTIEEALDAFIADQRHRLSARTMRNYDVVVDLLRHSLNGYGPNTLDKTDHKRWEKAFALAEVGRGFDITLARLEGVWRVVEVGNVCPM